MIRASFALAALLASLAATPGSARIAPIQQASGARGGDVPPSWMPPPQTPDKQCRVNEATKKRECHSRAEWRKIADESESQPEAQAPSTAP